MENLKQEFALCRNQEDIYQKIIAFGKKLSPYPQAEKCEEKRVQGCQSLMYLTVQEQNGRLYFNAFSEALISAGLAALLIAFYNGKTAEEVLKIPPTFLEDLKIPESLTPGRANGLSNLYLQMKKEALKTLIFKNRSPNESV